MEAELAYSVSIQLKSEPEQTDLQRLVEFQMEAFHLNAAILNLETLILNTRDSRLLVQYFRYLGQCYASLGIREAVDMCRRKISDLSKEAANSLSAVHNDVLEL